MFTRKEQLIKKTGPTGIDRRNYLSLLIQEFEKTNSSEARRQVLANLANFAYDPINYLFIRELGLIDTFLRQVSQPDDEESLRVALAGLCNLSADPQNADLIFKKNGTTLISRHLLHTNVEIALDSLATIIFLVNPETQASITSPEIISKVLRHQSGQDTRLANLANVFLTDVCTTSQIESARSVNLHPGDIPLPK